MAVGRNLACTKDIWLRAQQSEVWHALPSGDDDLLVSIGGTPDNVAVVFAKSAFTYSEAKATWAAWIKQKQRHLSTGKYYKNDIKLFLADYAASHTAMWIGFTILLFSAQWKMALLLVTARCLIYWTLWFVTARKVNEKKLVYLSPLFDLGWMVYNFAFLPYITWKNKKNWK